MNLIYGHEDAIAPWLARKYGVHLRRPCVTLGCIDSAGVLRGAFVLTMMHDTTAELHVYGRVSNDTVREMFEAVFNQFGIYRLELRISKRNKITKKAAPRFGFRFEGAAPHFFGPGEAALLFSMRADECRWLRKDDGITARRV